MAIQRRQRLRFDSVEQEIYPNGRCRVTVRLEWAGKMHVGEAEGTQPLDGDLRTAAHATLQAAGRACAGQVRLHLMGLKTFKAFDATVLVASVHASSEEQTWRLLGSHGSAEDDRHALLRSTVRTVLDAINRVVELYIGDPAA